MCYQDQKLLTNWSHVCIIKRMICCLVELKGRSRLMSGWYVRSIFDNSVKVEVSNH